MAMQLLVLTASNFEVGSCRGPRYWVPFLPWMAVAAMYTVRATGWTWDRFPGVGSRQCRALILGALRYPQMFSLSPWFLWHPEVFRGGGGGF